MRPTPPLVFLLCALAGANCGCSLVVPGFPGPGAGLRAKIETGRGLWEAIAGLRTGPHNERDARIAKAANSFWAATRVAAAAALADPGRANARPLLEKLLADPDVLVRRVAAESLLGRAARQDAAAKHHAYTEVLAAEAKARDLLGIIRRADLARQYDATQELIALGWPAFWELNRHIRHRSLTMSLSAALAAAEIETDYENVPPAWAREIERELDERRVSFDFQELPLEEALRRLSTAAGVPIRLKEADRPEQPEKLTLSVSDMRPRSALNWVTKIVGYRYALRDGAILVYPSVHADGIVTLLVDVRDLEAMGIRPDWRKVLHCHVPAVRGEWGFETRNGILLIDLFVSVGDWGKSELAQVKAYLANLRELVKLDPERVRELELWDRGGLF